MITMHVQRTLPEEASSCLCRGFSLFATQRYCVIDPYAELSWNRCCVKLAVWPRIYPGNCFCVFCSKQFGGSKNLHIISDRALKSLKVAFSEKPLLFRLGMSEKERPLRRVRRAVLDDLTTRPQTTLHCRSDAIEPTMDIKLTCSSMRHHNIS